VAVQTHPDLPRNLAYRERLREHLADPPGSGGSRVALLKLATLLHDNAKPQTKQIKPEGGISFYGHQDIGAEIAQAVGQRLRLSRQEVAYVALVVREHMRPGQLRNTPGVTPRAIARFLRDTGAAGPDLLLHNLADHMATRGPLIDPDDWRHHLTWTGELLDTCWGQPPERSRPLVSGHDLMQHLGIAPGKLVGTLLEEIQTAQAAGEINTPDEALALARRMISEWEAEGPG
jgi:poly(A) polymerase/tRNA nucleotidyltransferase (CCA-adding enzyme)